jgi:hypothetical protein
MLAFAHAQVGCFLPCASQVDWVSLYLYDQHNPSWVGGGFWLRSQVLGWNMPARNILVLVHKIAYSRFVDSYTLVP